MFLGTVITTAVEGRLVLESFNTSEGLYYEVNLYKHQQDYSILTETLFYSANKQQASDYFGKVLQERKTFE